MTKQNKSVLIALIVILTFNFVIIPFFHRREATRTVTDVLGFWMEGDLAASFKYFVSDESSPPVYGVDSYTILSKKFGRKKGRRYALIVVDVEFSPGNILLSGEWVFVVRHLPRAGWRIIEFQRLNL